MRRMGISGFLVALSKRHFVVSLVEGLDGASAPLGLSAVGGSETRALERLMLESSRDST